MTWCPHTPQDPMSGQGVVAEQIGQFLRHLALEVHEGRLRVREAVGLARGDAFGGRAGDAYRERAEGVKAAMERFIAMIDDAASTCERASLAWSELSVQAERAKASLEQARADATNAPFAARNRFPSRNYSANAEGRRQCEVRRDVFRQQLLEDASSREWQALAELARIEAERHVQVDLALVRALDQMSSSTVWGQVAGVLAAGGVGAVGLTRARVRAALGEVVRANVARARRIGAGRGFGPGIEADVVELGEFFDRYGADGSVMSSFFTELGGAGTVGLIDGIGQAAHNNVVDGGAALAFALAVRGGLSVGSQGWGAQQAQQFAAGMFAVTGNGDYMAGEVGFLFSDPAEHPLGPELAYAAAVKVDEIERVQGREPLYELETFGFSGGRWLSDLEVQAGGVSDWHHPALDASGRVLEMLGVWPGRALDFLVPPDGGLGQDRVDFWFGRRDWSGHDGFLGPASLWGGAVSAAGGPLDGWSDPGVCERIAQLSPRVVTALAGNPSFAPENASEAGATALGRALGAQMNVVAETLVSAGNDDLTWMFGMDEPGAFANFNTGNGSRAYADLAEVMSVAAFQEGGRAQLETAIGGYQEFVLQFAHDNPGYPTGLGYGIGRAAMDRVAALQGLVDGSLVGGQTAAARQEAANREGTRDVLAMVAEEGIGAAPGVGLFLSQLVSLLGDKVTDPWVNEALNDLNAAREREEDDRVVSVKAALARMAKELSSVNAVGGVPADRLVDDVYGDNYVKELGFAENTAEEQ